MTEGGWVVERSRLNGHPREGRRANLLRAKLKSVSKGRRVLALHIPGGSTHRAGGFLAQTKYFARRRTSPPPLCVVPFYKVSLTVRH
jgi:hypothetical protein